MAHQFEVGNDLSFVRYIGPDNDKSCLRTRYAITNLIGYAADEITKEDLVKLRDFLVEELTNPHYEE